MGKHIRLNLRSISLRKMLQLVGGTLVFFTMNLMIAVYTNVNTTLLGFYSAQKETGYFSVGFKIIQLLLIFINALVTVLLPRLSNYHNAGNMKSYNDYLRKAFKYILIMTVAVACGVAIFIRDIVSFIGGAAFTRPRNVSLSWLGSLSSVGYRTR